MIVVFVFVPKLVETLKTTPDTSYDHLNVLSKVTREVLSVRAPQCTEHHSLILKHKVISDAEQI